MQLSPGPTEVLILLFFAIPIFVAIRMFWRVGREGAIRSKVRSAFNTTRPINLRPLSVPLSSKTKLL